MLNLKSCRILCLFSGLFILGCDPFFYPAIHSNFDYTVKVELVEINGNKICSIMDPGKWIVPGFRRRIFIKELNVFHEDKLLYKMTQEDLNNLRKQLKNKIDDSGWEIDEKGIRFWRNKKIIAEIKKEINKDELKNEEHAIEQRDTSQEEVIKEELKNEVHQETSG